MSKIHRSDGQLTAYGFACGYLQIQKTDDRYKQMFMEHSHYHVQWGFFGKERMGWETFDNKELSKARTFYEKLKLSTLHIEVENKKDTDNKE